MERLKKLRKEKGYTQESLAKKVGVATGTISSYEQGLRNITVPMAIKLGLALDADWTIFFEDEVSDSYDKVK